MNYFPTSRRDYMSDLTLDQQVDITRATKVLDNAKVTSNIIEVVVGVVSKVAGKDISDTISGNTINRNLLSNLVAKKLKDKVLGDRNAQ